jgi:glycosyltransferase involved in cell wall biosynthesis
MSVLSFARDLWTDVPRCRHHVLSRLAPSSRVLFVSPPATHIRDAIRQVPKGGFAQSGLTEVSPELFTFVPPPWLPYSDRPFVNRALEVARAGYIRHLLARLGMQHPILYVWHPAFVDMVERFDAALVVYHCYDEYGAFRGARRKEIEAQEARLLQRADVVFTVSTGLRERRVGMNPNTHVVHNGVDADSFAAALAPETVVAPDIAAIPRPIVGCISRVVPEYFDAALLREVFRKRRDLSLVVIGPESPPQEFGGDDLERLKAEPNVHFLGMRPFESLPSYLKAMDVCTIPYRVTGNTQLADPLKLYEYLAAGKPIVSVPRDFSDDVRPFVRTGAGADEWVAAIEESLATDSPELRAARQAVAHDNTWDQRIDQISHLIRAALARRENASSSGRGLRRIDHQARPPAPASASTRGTTRISEVLIGQASAVRCRV